MDLEFEPLNALSSPRPRRRGFFISLLLHGLALACLIYPATPRFIRPSATLMGKNGTSTVYLYLPSTNATLAAAQELNTEENRQLYLPIATRKRLEIHKRRQALARTPQELHEAESAQTNQAPAGSLYGSLSYGDTEGSEVRPAIRVSGSEPAVNEFDLAGVKEGNIIVEVTIDQRGNIIQKTVLQSLNPSIDQKVLAALEDWHFLPALRDGDAISSKQDVYYHFPIHR